MGGSPWCLPSHVRQLRMGDIPWDLPRPWSQRRAAAAAGPVPPCRGVTGPTAARWPDHWPIGTCTRRRRGAPVRSGMRQRLSQVEGCRRAARGLPPRKAAAAPRGRAAEVCACSTKFCACAADASPVQVCACYDVGPTLRLCAGVLLRRGAGHFPGARKPDDTSALFNL
jgi:hypothetical protein